MSKNSYRPCCTGEHEVKIRGYGGKRFPPRKAGIPVKEIAEYVRDEMEHQANNRAGDAKRKATIKAMQAQVDKVHKLLKVDINPSAFRQGPHLEVGSGGQNVSINFLNSLTLEQGQAILKLMLELGVS